MLNKDGKLLDSNGTSMRSIDEDESSLYDLREGMDVHVSLRRWEEDTRQLLACVGHKCQNHHFFPAYFRIHMVNDPNPTTKKGWDRDLF
jgi:hypothetical protein